MRDRDQIIWIVFAMAVLIAQSKIMGEGTPLAFLAGLITLSTVNTTMIMHQVRDYVKSIG